MAVTTIIKSGVTNEIFNVAGGFEQKYIDTVTKVFDCYFKDDRKNVNYKELLD